MPFSDRGRPKTAESARITPLASKKRILSMIIGFVESKFWSTYLVACISVPPTRRK
jgi:hypothetical protein